jgi:uncharacterized LabA/DUF88 family protein
VESQKIRAAVYFDGFNLYHSIQELDSPFLKWLNLWKLSECIIEENEALETVTFCTAYYPGDSQKKFRHDNYLNALRISGVRCIMGHYVGEPKLCKSCDARWTQPNEKASDINLALSVIHDGYSDVYDTAYLVSADTDQVATAKKFREMFPKKRIVTVAPPGRILSAHLKDVTDAAVKINPDFLEYALFDPTVMDPIGNNHGRRPREYAPPDGWVAPAYRKASPPLARL